MRLKSKSRYFRLGAAQVIRGILILLLFSPLAVGCSANFKIQSNGSDSGEVLAETSDTSSAETPADAASQTDAPAVAPDGPSRTPGLSVGSKSNLENWTGDGTSTSPLTFSIKQGVKGEIVLTLWPVNSAADIDCPDIPSWITFEASLRKIVLNPGQSEVGTTVSFACSTTAASGTVETIEFKITVLEVNDLPVFVFTDLPANTVRPYPVRDLVEIAYHSADPDSDLDAEFFLQAITATSCSGGTPVSAASPIIKGDGTFVWNTNSVATGEYYLCARVSDHVADPVDFVSAGRIKIEKFCSGHNLVGALIANGAGTPSDPYLICTAEQLNGIGANSAIWDKTFVQAEDLDLSPLTGTSFNMIGDQTTPFIGTYDGGGHAINGFTYTDPARDRVGMFGQIGATGVVKNLVFNSASVTGRDYTAIVAAYSLGIIHHITLNSSAVSGRVNVGGVSGFAVIITHAVATSITVVGSGDRIGGLGGHVSVTLSDSSVTGTVTGLNNEVGGLVGYKYSACGAVSVAYVSELARNWSTATVTGVDAVGGLVGHNQTGNCQSHISSSWYNGNVNGRNQVGALAGDIETSNGRVMDSWATGTVTATGNEVGGLVGRMNGRINRSWSDNTVITTGNQVGGLIGSTYRDYYCGATLFFSYALGSVTGADLVGGLGGNMGCQGNIYLSYSHATVTGVNDVGGAVGLLDSKAYYSYATGAITATGTNIGGFAGRLAGSLSVITISDVYAAPTSISGGGSSVGGVVGRNEKTLNAVAWDTTTSGVAVMCGTNVGGTGCNNARGYPTSTMKIGATFSAIAWDLSSNEADGPSDVWDMQPSSYPTLYWQNPAPVDYAARFSAGSGTVADPYLISDRLELNRIGYNPILVTKHFQLASSLDLSAFTVSPIGSEVFPFQGSLDGTGYTLSNLNISQPSQDYVGIFRYIALPIWFNYNEGPLPDPVIKNLNLTGVTVTGRDYTGSIAGFSSGRFVAVSVTGAVNGRSAVGLIGGWLQSGGASLISAGTVTASAGGAGGIAGAIGSIVNSSSSATVTAATGGAVGGIAGSVNGYFSSTGVDNVYATGNVTGTADGGSVGGLFGSTSTDVSNSWASGNVSGGSMVGGLVGDIGSSGHKITNSYATGNVTGTQCSVGGLIGDSNRISLLGVYATGTVIGKCQVGGLVGRTFKLRELHKSWWAGTSVTGEDRVGGLIGYFTTDDYYGTGDGLIADSYARGAVVGKDNISTTQYLGGLFGYSHDYSTGTQESVVRSFFAGSLTQGINVTGTVHKGNYFSYGLERTTENVFFDSDLISSLADIGYSTSASLANVDVLEVVGLTTTTLTTSPYTPLVNAGFDFSNTWDAGNAGSSFYPILRFPVTVPAP